MSRFHRLPQYSYTRRYMRTRAGYEYVPYWPHFQTLTTNKYKELVVGARRHCFLLTARRFAQSMPFPEGEKVEPDTKASDEATEAVHLELYSDSHSLQATILNPQTGSSDVRIASSLHLR